MTAAVRDHSQLGLDQTRSARLLWDAATRERVAARGEAALKTSASVVHSASAMLNGTTSPDIAALIRSYVAGVGSEADVNRYRLSDVIDQVGHSTGVLGASDRYFHHPWRLKREAVECHCPDLLPFMFEEHSNAGLVAIPLLDACPNELQYRGFPPGIVSTIHRPERPGHVAYQTSDAIAYVDPFCYQIMSADRGSSWISGSPRFLSRAAIPDEPVEAIERTLVIVQDRFSFSNLSHFLFDGVTRILNYAAAGMLNGNELFVFGGMPGEYQAVVLTALCDTLGLGLDSILFPDRPQLLRPTTCVWFSDQVDTPCHPAIWGHPHAVSPLVQLCDSIPAEPSPHPRIYVSRADASQRRVVNEAALLEALAPFGFVSVSLSGMPATEQIGLFRGAEFVIGPHGQGLSHLIMGRRLSRLIELFHPASGTDCYAWMSRASGIQYDAIIGTACPGTPVDFQVDVDHVVRAIGNPAWTGASRLAMHPANLLPGSRDFSRFTALNDTDGTDSDRRMLKNHRALRHALPLGGAHEMEVGCWSSVGVAPGQTYTASCWVWVPSGGAVSRVFLHVNHSTNELIKEADTDRNDGWQQVATVATALELGQCVVALHMQGLAGAYVLSTAWQLERGTRATAYVSTG